MNEQAIDIPEETWVDVSEDQLRAILNRKGDGQAVPAEEAGEGCPGPAPDAT